MFLYMKFVFVNVNKTISILSIFVIVGIVTITTTVVNSQSVIAVPAGTCTLYAKDFASGQEKNIVESNFNSGAKAFTPGQEAKITGGTCLLCNGKEFAPGQE